MNENLKTLKRNTILIAIANIGSRAISFILAPLYSYYLTTEQYGTMDLITTTCSLIGPLVCLDIYEATFRFTKDEKYDNKHVISTSLIVCIVELVLCGIIFAGYSAFRPIRLSVLVCAVSVVVESIQCTLTQYARGKDKISIFAFSGVLHSIVILLANVLFLIALRMELIGWMISFVLAKVVVLVYLSFRLKIWKDLSIGFFDKVFLRDALRFSLPLMPSASMWWIMNASDRYILSFYWGVAATGIYAVAAKLPSILSVFENVFYQAWQTTAIDTLNQEDREKLYSDIFRNYFRVMAVGVIGILVILKPLILLLFSKEYHDGWLPASILVIGVMIHALGGNIGVLYTVFKDTKGALKTSFIGAVTNIILNFIFIPKFGMIAAACTTLVGYIAVLSVRWIDIRKFVRLQFLLKDESVTIVLIVAQFILYYVPGIVSYIIRTAILCVAMYMSKDIILKLIKRR